jgi:hypothetical protein
MVRARGGGSRLGLARPWAVLVAVLAALGALLGSIAVAGGAGPAGAQQGGVDASVDDDDLGWGERTTVHGFGFAPGATVQIILYAGGIVLGEPVAGEDGSFDQVITIPEGLGSSAEYVLAVQGPSAAGVEFGYVEVPLTIRGPEPTMSVDVLELHWDETVTVRGERWEPGTSVDISLAPTTQVLATVTVGGDGSFAAPVTIPSGLPSSQFYEIVVTGQGVDKLFHYLPQQVTIIGLPGVASVSPTELAWEQTAVVRGDRFLAGSTAQVHLLPDTILLAEVEVDSAGHFEVAVRIPTDLPSSTEYQILVTGTGGDAQFAYLPMEVTIIGDRPSVAVTPVSGRRALQVEGRRFFRGTQAVLTMLPGFERLGEVEIAADGTFSTTVEITDAITGADPHYLVVTGQGADGLFAYLSTEVNLADGGLTVGGLVRPPGVRPPARERPERPTLRDPLASLHAGLRQRPLPNESEGADELFLALILLAFFAAAGWFLNYSLHNDVRAGLARQRQRIQHRLRPGRG